MTFKKGDLIYYSLGNGKYLEYVTKSPEDGEFLHTNFGLCRVYMLMNLKTDIFRDL